MYDLLLELKEYIKEHYTGNDIFEPVAYPMPCVCRESSVDESYPPDDIEEFAAVAQEKSSVLHSMQHSCSNRKTPFFGDMALKKERSLEDRLRDTDDTFSDRLFTVINEKGIADVELYKKANLDRRLFSKLRNKSYKPSKNTILALILALELDMQEARDLLSFAGYNLAPNDKTDIIVSFFLEKQVYDIFTVNEVLDSYGEKCLGNSIQ